MKIIIAKNYEEASKQAAEIVLEVVKKKPDATLGLATGTTPLKLYEELCEDYQKNQTSWKDIKSYNLDEYVGLAPDHPQSYHKFMNDHLFSHIDIKDENTHVPSGLGDPEDVCDKYNKMLEENPRDLQILGIGSNGHIGFNEPGTDFDSVTHLMPLKESTILDNAHLFFNDDIDAVPKASITMGIKNIMDAKEILVMAFGTRKQKVVKKLIDGEITNEYPVTILNKHPNVTLIVDEEAGALIK